MKEKQSLAKLACTLLFLLVASTVALAQTRYYYNSRGAFAGYSTTYNTTTYFYDARGGLTLTARHYVHETYLYDSRGAFLERLYEGCMLTSGFDQTGNPYRDRSYYSRGSFR